jgi:hypothetical protein
MTSDNPEIFQHQNEPPSHGTSTVPMPVAPARALTDPIADFSQQDVGLGVERATAIANVLADIVDQRGLSVRIGGGEHLKIEAWQTLAMLVGVSSGTEWSRAIYNPRGEYEGEEARCQVLRTATGQLITAGEAGCYADENQKRRDGTFVHRWIDACEGHSSRPTGPCGSVTRHAIKSMAQTRAASKALSSALRFIPVLAGFAGTPAEEMDGITPSGQGGQGGRRGAGQSGGAISEGQAGRISAIAYSRAQAMPADPETGQKIHGYAIVDAVLRAAGGETIPRGTRKEGFVAHMIAHIPKAQYEAFCAAVETWHSGEPLDFSLAPPTAEDAISAGATSEGEQAGA